MKINQKNHSPYPATQVNLLLCLHSLCPCNHGNLGSGLASSGTFRTQVGRAAGTCLGAGIEWVASSMGAGSYLGVRRGGNGKLVAVLFGFCAYFVVSKNIFSSKIHVN